MRHTRSFEHAPESVPEARHFARELARGSAADVIDAIELMVSELVTNCIRHTDSGFDLTIALSPERIRVEVTDGGLGEPGMRFPRPSDPTGRGLRIVDMLSTDWGHEKPPGGRKTVWFTLTLEPESSTAGAAAARAHPAREESISRRRTAGRRRPGQPASRTRGRTHISESGNRVWPRLDPGCGQQVGGERGPALGERLLNG
jgi:anti-sigma regulatory factor (Ser/Thr protein kinase)